jgi:hypothetical protein
MEEKKVRTKVTEVLMRKKEVLFKINLFKKL